MKIKWLTTLAHALHTGGSIPASHGRFPCLPSRRHFRGLANAAPVSMGFSDAFGHDPARKARKVSAVRIPFPAWLCRGRQLATRASEATASLVASADTKAPIWPSRPPYGSRRPEGDGRALALPGFSRPASSRSSSSGARSGATPSRFETARRRHFLGRRLWTLSRPRGHFDAPRLFHSLR